MIICDPEIRVLKIQPNFDYILLGCDGLFDRLNNREIIDTVWDATFDCASSQTSKGNHFLKSL